MKNHSFRNGLVLCAAVLSVSMASAEANYNVVRAAITAGHAPEYAGGRRSGFSYSETFPVAALFDGVSENATPTNGWVGGILSAGYAEVKLPEAYFASLAAVPEVTTYRVHRFNYGSDYRYAANVKTVDLTAEKDVCYAPTAWKLEGTANGRDWVTIDEQTGIEWGETEYAKTFALATAGKYIGFRFVPTNSYRFANRSAAVLPPEQPFDVGLMEIEYLAEAPTASGVMFVTSDYPNANGYSVVTASGTIAAPRCGYDGKKRFGGVTGYTLSTWTNGAWVDGNAASGTSYEFAADGTAKKLTWHFDEANVTGYRLDAQVVAPGYESFTYSPAADAAGYYDKNAVVTVTPVEHAEPPYSYFHRWEGDGVTKESAKTKVLTVTMDGAKTVKCWFDRAWKYFDSAKEVTALGYLARRDQWNNLLSSVAFDGCHAFVVSRKEYTTYEPSYWTAAASLSEGGRVNFTLSVWVDETESHNKGLFANLSYPPLLGAAEMVVGANIGNIGNNETGGPFLWTNLVHVEGMRLTTGSRAPVFARLANYKVAFSAPVTNDIMELIPAKATKIPAGAFAGTKVSGVFLDAPYVTHVGSSAFYGTGIRELVLTNAAFNTIGDTTHYGCAFKGMSALEMLTLCATNFTTAKTISKDYLPASPAIIKKMWFVGACPDYFLGTSAMSPETETYKAWGSKPFTYNWNTFEKKHDTYIYASKRQPGWQTAVLPVSQFSDEEKALKPEGCFGIVLGYVNDKAGQKIAWAVHRDSPDDKARGFLLIVR